MLTITEAAQRLKVSNDTIYNWYKAGKITIHFESSRNRYVSEEDVKLIESNKLPDGMKRCNECGKVNFKALFITGINICKYCKPKYNKKKWDKDGPKSNQKRKEKYHNNKERFAINDRKYRYDITEEEYNKMLENSNGCCAICKNPTNKLQIDHDHFNGKVRDLLCRKCNFGLGQFNDNITNLANAIKYLNLHSENNNIKQNYCGYYFCGC